MKRLSLIIGLVILVLALVTGGLWLFRPDLLPRQVTGAPEQVAALIPAQEQNDGLLRASGSIEVNEVIVSAELAGLVKTLYTEEADSVSAGQVLAQLDTTLLEAQMQQAQAAVQNAEAQLAQIKAGVQPEEIGVGEAAANTVSEQVKAAEKAVEAAQGKVATAQALLQAAQAQRAALRAGASPYDVALAQEQVAMIESTVAPLLRMRDATGGSESGGLIPPGSYDAAQAVVSQTELQADIAQVQLELLQAGVRSEDLAAANAAVQAAQAGVDAAQTQVVQAQQRLQAARAGLRQAEAQVRLLEAGASEEEITIAEAQVGSARATLRILQVQLEKATVKAPGEGLIAERTARVGEQVAPGTALFRLVNLENVKVTVYVPEGDLGRVRVGQPVGVSVDSFPGRTFEGQVIYISPQAEFTPSSSAGAGARTNQVFGIRIEVPNPGRLLKPGMPADVVFNEG